MIGRLLRFGMAFDWITPTMAIAGKASGNQEIVKVPQDWIGFVGDTLSAEDIDTHNDMLIDGDYVFSVDANDIDEVVELLGLVKQ